MQNILEEDTDNTFAWAQRVSVFDAFGFLISRQTTFDDGQVRSETVTDGVITQTDWNDPNNQVVWSLKTTTKDPSTGYITTKTVTLDDGQSITKTFNNNVQSSQVIADVDDNFGFTTKTKLFDSSGQITSYQINYDDGRTSMTSFDDGVRTASTLTDTASAYNWETRFFDYDDATGKLISVTTTFDTGVVETELAAVGPISKSVVQHDNMNRFAWDTITTQYDGTGQLQNKRVVFDDGVESDKQFTDGVQATLQLTDVDDAHNWATQSKTYDTAGRLATETRTMDDGRVITRNFDAGTQTSKSVLDQNDQYNWARQDWTYDAAGLPSSKVTEYDNGMRETVNFSAGIIESRTQLDLADVKNWQSIQSVFADNGTLLYREITDDDGNKRFLDARKQVIITGGTDAQVSEDATPQLEATGQIEIVAGYRGSGSFTAQSGVLGSAGLGHFTLNTDGSWSYNAVNNQTAVQTLNAGESLTDSFTAVTTDGVETEITVTINGTDDSAAPLYVGGDIVTIGAEGSRAGLQAPFDLATLFSDDMGDDLSISVTGLPAHLSVTDGVLTQVPRAFSATDSRDHFVTVTATDTSGLSTSQVVQLSIAVDHHFNVHPGAVFRGSNSADIVTSRNWEIGNFHSRTTIFLLSGDDIADFGSGTGDGSELNIDGGSGDDTLTFEDSAALSFGELEVFGGLGADVISFGGSAASSKGIVRVFGDYSGGAGGDADVIRFGTNAAEGQGEVVVDAGGGNDQIIFGSRAGLLDGTVEVNAGTGHDQITFGDNAENLTIRFGSDSDTDTVTFQGSVKNTVIHDWVQGDDTITFSAATGLWTAVDSGADKVFTSDDGQSFTVKGAAGVAGGDIVTGLEINDAPMFIGSTTPLLGTTGSLRSEDIAFDLASLFSDDRTDDLTISVSGLDARFTVIDGVLQPLAGHDASLSGTHSFTVTATDEHGRATSQVVTAEVALENRFFEPETYNLSGSNLADTLIIQSQIIRQGNETVNTFDGDDIISFANNSVSGSAGDRYSLNVNSGAGNDRVLFGEGTTFAATLQIDLGTGQDHFGLGDHAASRGGIIEIVATGDAIGDTFEIGQFASRDSSHISLTSGDGDDTITFGTNAGKTGSNLSLSGRITINANAGADQITFGDGAEQTIIYLGDQDGDADNLTFLGTLKNAAIGQWEEGVDTINFTSATGIWTVVDRGGDRVFTANNDQSFVVIGAAGIDASDIVTGLTYNTAPSYVGMGEFTDESGNHYYDIGLAGSGTEAATFDLNALFSDVDAGAGDSFTISVDTLPAGLSLTDGVLSILNTSAALAHTAAGDHVVNVTATDASGASVTQTLRLSIALDHDFGDNATVSSVTGSSFDDRLTFGEYPAVFSSMTVSLGAGEDTLIFADRGGVESTLTLDTGADDDTIEFGHFAAVTGNVSIATGKGTDSITLGDHAATASGTLSITDTGGDTVISFGNNAGVTNGVVNITLDDGADQVNFGINAGTDNGEINIASGAGADQFIFDDNAANLVIDLGQDSDIDSVTFLGSVRSATIENWEEGVDIVDVLDPSTWTLMVDGTGTTLSNGVNEIRFAGITGLTDVSDFLI